MTKTFRSFSATATLMSLLLAVAPAGATLDIGTGRLEGSVRGFDGRPAAGYGVVLVDREGGTVARAATSREGAFLFGEVPAGSYHLEVVDRTGASAPLAGPATSVGAGSKVRRDVQLVRNVGTGAFAQTHFGPNSESWWSRRTRNQKILAFVAIAVGAGVVLAVVNNLEDDETQASPSSP